MKDLIEEVVHVVYFKYYVVQDKCYVVHVVQVVHDNGHPEKYISSKNCQSHHKEVKIRALEVPQVSLRGP